MTCPLCRDRGVIVVIDFDGRTARPCPSCHAKDPHERARAKAAMEFGTDRQRREKRAPLRAPR